MCSSDLVQEEAVKASSQSLELALNQYRAGLISFLPVVVAQNNALANLRTAANLLGQRMSASVQLITALGGDWSVAELPFQAGDAPPKPASP